MTIALYEVKYEIGYPHGAGNEEWTPIFKGCHMLKIEGGIKEVWDYMSGTLQNLAPPGCLYSITKIERWEYKSKHEIPTR